MKQYDQLPNPVAILEQVKLLIRTMLYKSEKYISNIENEVTNKNGAVLKELKELKVYQMINQIELNKNLESKTVLIMEKEDLISQMQQLENELIETRENYDEKMVSVTNKIESLEVIRYLKKSLLQDRESELVELREKYERRENYIEKLLVDVTKVPELRNHIEKLELKAEIKTKKAVYTIL